MIINNLEIKKGKVTKVNLNIARLKNKEIIDIPIQVIRSNKPGPTILLMAGMHGDEINGVEIIHRLIKSKKLKPLKGSIILVPTLNLFGYQNKTRYTYDNIDLNRSFPGNAKGSVTEKIAYKFMQEIFPLADVIIDFHTGGGQRTNYPQVRCSFKIENQMEWAKLFNQPMIMNAGLRKNSLRKQATLKKVPYLLFEGGKSLSLDEEAINSAIEGTLNLLSKKRIIKEQFNFKQQDAILVKDSNWVKGEKTGILKSYFEPGQFVKQGVLLGEIKNGEGKIVEKLQAEFDGVIVGMELSPVVNRGDALYHIGKLV